MTLCAHLEGGAAVIDVEDRGAGIPEEDLPHLFRPFFRGSLRPNQEGLGLGLFIASEIARVHGGTLAAASDPGETRFTFRMPLGNPPEGSR